MSVAPDTPAASMTRAELGALGFLFVFSRVPWVVSSYYYDDQRAAAFAGLTLAASLLIVLAGYVTLKLVPVRHRDWLARTAVLTMFLYLVAVQLRQILAPGVILPVYLLIAIAAAGLALAGLGAARLAAVWSRLRSAMIAAALIGATSAFLLVAVLAPRVPLLANSGPRHRAVVVLLLDEFSAGASRELEDELARLELHVGSWPVTPIGRNTIDTIPAILSGVHLTDARPCTPTAVCGRSRVVDFARMSVGRGDVDVIGAYHRYCAISGLRHCVIPLRGLEGPVMTAFLCALPIRILAAEQLECSRPGFAPSNAAAIAAATEARLLDAPFWSRGGLLYAHVLLPHPPSPGGEPSLTDAYAANLVRARALVAAVADRLGSSAFREDFTIVVTSDHPLRARYWCTVEPYSGQDCTLPESLHGDRVPFIVATRGAPIAHREPHSNADLLAIVDDLSRPR